MIAQLIRYSFVYDWVKFSIDTWSCILCIEKNIKDNFKQNIIFRNVWNENLNIDTKCVGCGASGELNDHVDYYNI